MLKTFDQLPFYPDGIDAIMRMGEAAHPHLLEALGADGSVSPHLHFNLSLALGTMEVEAARPIFEGALAASTNPIERIGSAYGLVCLGESKWLGEILAALDHASDDVRHAAAVGLEHLPQPLEDAVYARHLSDMNMLVRLRLTRKLGSQGTDNPALVDALIARLEDNEEAIRSAAIDAVAALGAEGIYDRMVMLAQSENPTLRACAYRVLGKRSDPRAIPLLIQVIQEDSTPGARKAAISALGDLGAITAVEEIGTYLDDEELSDAAFWALLSIGMKDSETVKEVLNRRPYQKKRPSQRPAALPWGQVYLLYGV